MTKRIQKELSELWINPPAFCRLGASPVMDPYHFEVIIKGPAGSPYADGTFPVDVLLPKDYPFKPPTITFKTKVYHPNIDAEGELFLDIFKSKWTPALRLSTVLFCIVSVLYNPLLDHPVRRDVAHQYCHEQALFQEMARRCIRGHALEPVVSLYPAGKKEGDSMARSSRLQYRESCGSGWRFFNLLLRPLWAADR